MITHPRADELTRAVAGWIDEIRPSLDPRNAFLARVAANALAMVARELESGDAARTAAAQRLSELLGCEGTYQSLSLELCRRIRAGEVDAGTSGLLPTLRANVLDQLAIDQPNYKHEGPSRPVEV